MRLVATSLESNVDPSSDGYEVAKSELGTGRGMILWEAYLASNRYLSKYRAVFGSLANIALK